MPALQNSTRFRPDETRHFQRMARPLIGSLGGCVAKRLRTRRTRGRAMRETTSDAIKERAMRGGKEQRACRIVAWAAIILANAHKGFSGKALQLSHRPFWLCWRRGFCRLVFRHNTLANTPKRPDLAQGAAGKGLGSSSCLGNVRGFLETRFRGACAGVSGGRRESGAMGRLRSAGRGDQRAGRAARGARKI